jgi:hypothetical protein
VRGIAMERPRHQRDEPAPARAFEKFHTLSVPTPEPWS